MRCLFVEPERPMADVPAPLHTYKKERPRRAALFLCKSVITFRFSWSFEFHANPFLVCLTCMSWHFVRHLQGVVVRKAEDELIVFPHQLWVGDRPRDVLHDGGVVDHFVGAFIGDDTLAGAVDDEERAESAITSQHLPYWEKHGVAVGL